MWLQFEQFEIEIFIKNCNTIIVFNVIILRIVFICCDCVLKSELYLNNRVIAPEMGCRQSTTWYVLTILDTKRFQFYIVGNSMYVCVKRNRNDWTYVRNSQIASFTCSRHSVSWIYDMFFLVDKSLQKITKFMQLIRHKLALYDRTTNIEKYCQNSSQSLLSTSCATSWIGDSTVILSNLFSSEWMPFLIIEWTENNHVCYIQSVNLD